MAILTDPPEWEVPGTKPPRNIIEVVGWEVGSRPPAPWWNWFFYTVAKSLRELETATLARIINEAGVPGIMAGPESERPAASPETVGRIFIAIDTKRMYRDRGNGWDLLNTPEAIGAETPAGAQAKAEAAASAALSGVQAYVDQAVAAHAGRTDNPHQVTAAQLGLGDVLTHLAQILDSRIVEMGTNSNGTYVRWENGLQVCFGRTGLIVFPNGSGSAATVTFPAAFISPPTVSMAGARDDTFFASQFRLELGLFVTATGFQVLYSNDHTNLTRQVLWIAIGAWK